MTLGGPKTLGSLCLAPTICFGIAAVYGFARSDFVGGIATIGFAAFFGVSAWRAFTGRPQLFSTPMTAERRALLSTIFLAALAIVYGLEVCFEAWRLDREFSNRVQLFLFAGALLIAYGADALWNAVKRR